jgi:hypothetical protein
MNHEALAGHPHIIEVREVFLTRCNCSICLLLSWRVWGDPLEDLLPC